MRKVRFRAWDNHEYDAKLKMWEWKEIQESYMNDIFDNEFDRFELMQYTGLKDKNGKEIYESDILRGHGNKDDLVQVCFGEFFVIDVESLEKVEEVHGWFTKVIHTDALSQIEPFCLDMPLADYYIDRAEFEVIGNIYENPELLKEAE